MASHLPKARPPAAGFLHGKQHLRRCGRLSVVVNRNRHAGLVVSGHHAGHDRVGVGVVGEGDINGLRGSGLEHDDDVARRSVVSLAFTVVLVACGDVLIDSMLIGQSELVLDRSFVPEMEPNGLAGGERQVRPVDREIGENEFDLDIELAVTPADRRARLRKAGCVRRGESNLPRRRLQEAGLPKHPAAVGCRNANPVCRCCRRPHPRRVRR